MKCVTLAKRLSEADKKVFEEAIGLCVELSIKDSTPIREILLDGFFYLRKNGLDFSSDKKLRKRILDVGDYKLVFEAKRMATAYAKGGSKIWAEGILRAVNFALRHNYALLEKQLDSGGANR